jgi:hypothetical protein
VEQAAELQLAVQPGGAEQSAAVQQAPAAVEMQEEPPQARYPLAQVSWQALFTHASVPFAGEPGHSAEEQHPELAMH